MIGLVISQIFSFFTSMDGYTKVFSAKDEKSAYKGTLYAAILCVVIAVAATYIGLVAKLEVPGLSDSSGSLAALVTERFPAGVKGLVLVSVMCAIMSTGDVCVLTTSSNFTRDIYQRYINKKASDKTMMTLSVISSVVVGVLSALFAWYEMDIINILFIAFTINSAGLFLPTICGLFWKKSNSNAAFMSILSSLIIVIGWYIGGVVSNLKIFEIEALWPAFIVSALIYFIMCICGKQSDEEIKKAEYFSLAKSEKKLEFRIWKKESFR